MNDFDDDLNKVDTSGVPTMEDMAFTKEKAMQTLDALQIQIARHLILLFLYPKSNPAIGWLQELEAWREQLASKGKGKKGTKNFKYHELENGIWEEPLGEPHDRIARGNEILAKKGMEIPSLEPRLEEFKRFVFRFIDSIHYDRPFSLTQ